jgi:hypothetical protein
MTVTSASGTADCIVVETGGGGTATINQWGNILSPVLDASSLGVATVDGRVQLADPGNGNAITPLQNSFVNLVTATGETRTLTDPVYSGQTIQLLLQTDAGDCTITAATKINQAGNNTLTFADAGDLLFLVGVDTSGAGLEWRGVSNDGIALSTV